MKRTPAKSVGGTVRLLNQSLTIIFYMIIAGVVLSATLSFAFGTIISGVGLFAMAGIVFSYRRIIWDSYAADFKKTKLTGIRKTLSAPSMAAYRITIYLLLPLIMVLGISLVVVGTFSSLN